MTSDEIIIHTSFPAAGHRLLDGEAPRQAIFILLDAARADRLSCYGYHRETTPNIDAMAERGVVFLEHFVQGTHTRATLPTIFYSRYFVPRLFPQSDRVPYASPEELFQGLDEEAVSMVRVLSGAGLRTTMLSAHSWLKPGTEFASQFDEVHDLSDELEVDQSYGYPRADQVINYAIDWIESHRHEDFFLYIHMMDTHFPHLLDADARELLSPDVVENPPSIDFGARGRPKGIGVELTAIEREYLDALYDGSLKYADRHLGRLFEYAEGGIRDPLIVITSDHGELLLEHPGRYLHGGPWYDLLARVPLIIASPGRLEPDRTGMFTEGVDVMPTILGLLGVSLPPGKRFDGVDLAARRTNPEARREHVFMKRAIRSAKYKGIFDGNIRGLLSETAPEISRLGGQLHDLETDPLEKENLWDEQPDLAAELFLRYREKMMPLHHRFTDTRSSITPRSPFAIEVKHLYSTPEAQEAILSIKDLPGELRASDPGERWLGDRSLSHLVAGPGTAPLQFELPVPSGRYILTASMLGACTMSIGEDDPRRLEAGALDLQEDFPWKGERAVYGVIEVQNDLLTGRMAHARGDDPFLIRHFGFRPIVEGDEGDGRLSEEDEELLERLRTLGYVD